MSLGQVYEDVQAAAAEWLVRLQSDDLDADQALAFDIWLTADPRHARAYDAALETAIELDRAAPRLTEALLAQGRRRGLFQRCAVAAGALAATIAVAVVVAPEFRPAPPQPYLTQKGEHRTLKLADGSVIELNAGTRLSVQLSRSERRVVLDQGQAVFDVASDARRPFLIAAGDRTVRVVGTQFDVRRREGWLSVTVAEGVVEVRPRDGAAGAAFRLRPGQRLDHREGAADARVKAASPEEVLGWRSGRLIYRDQPLSQVVADLNQQFPTPILIEDPKLAATPISGVFVLDDQAAVIRRLALLVSVTAVRSDAGLVLRRERAPGP